MALYFDFLNLSLAFSPKVKGLLQQKWFTVIKFIQGELVYLLGIIVILDQFTFSALSEYFGEAGFFYMELQYLY